MSRSWMRKPAKTSTAQHFAGFHLPADAYVGVPHFFTLSIFLLKTASVSVYRLHVDLPANISFVQSSYSREKARVYLSCGTRCEQHSQALTKGDESCCASRFCGASCEPYLERGKTGGIVELLLPVLQSLRYYYGHHE